MNLVDSSGWLEYFIEGKNAEFFAAVVEGTDNLIVSVINLYEVYKKIAEKRGYQVALEYVAVMKQAQVVEVNEVIAIEAANLSVEQTIPMADALIYMTAQINSATLWTQDNDFRGLAGVRMVDV